MGKLKWQIILVLALWLGFCGMASAERFYVDEGGWWRDGGVFNANGTPIQAAVGAAGAGDAIYVWNGSYTENVDVGTAHLTLEGEGADVVTMTAADSGDHVFEVADVNYVNISGFALRGATDCEMAGIYLDNANYCNISGDNVYGNSYGICMSSSSNNMLTNNTASNKHCGIYLHSSSSNTLKSNTANSNGYGIFLERSCNNNTLSDNTASNNWGGIFLEHSCNNNTLTSNNASDNNYGIYLQDSCNNTLSYNIASNNDCGIIIEFVQQHILSDNTASNNDCGIWLQSSSDSTLTSNTANSNNRGIYLYNADNNNITCNGVQNNTERGFYLTGGSTGNNISYNNIIENGDYNTEIGGWEWQFYMDQYNPVEAKHNYWGAGMNNSTIDASIYDDDEGMGKVEFYPFETEPVLCAPGPKRPAFTAADAVIALQIAVGSTPFESRYDVSRDGSVTSLDALMILQAAAGA